LKRAARFRRFWPHVSVAEGKVAAVMWPAGL
jgi:hypothetical protein